MDVITFQLRSDLKLPENEIGTKIKDLLQKQQTIIVTFFDIIFQFQLFSCNLSLVHSCVSIKRRENCFFKNGNSEVTLITLFAEAAVIY